MNTHMRHTLLMLAVLLGVMNPPGRPPGSESMKAEPPPSTPLSRLVALTRAAKGKASGKMSLPTRATSVARVLLLRKM